MSSYTIKLPFNNYIIDKHNDNAVTDANVVANVDAFPGVDLKTKLVHTLLQINSMEHCIYELESEVDQMGDIM